MGFACCHASAHPLQAISRHAYYAIPAPILRGQESTVGWRNLRCDGWLWRWRRNGGKFQTVRQANTLKSDLVDRGYFRLRVNRRRRNQTVESRAAPTAGFVEQFSRQAPPLSDQIGDNPRLQDRFGPADFKDCATGLVEKFRPSDGAGG